MRFRFYKQLDAMDCGPTCLRMIARHHGKVFSLQEIRSQCTVTREGISFFSLEEAAGKLGFRTRCSRVTPETLLEKAPLPCIIHWTQNHFVVFVSKRERHGQVTGVQVADPAFGLLRYTVGEFLEKWERRNNQGVVMLLEPMPGEAQPASRPKRRGLALELLRKHWRPFRGLTVQLLLGLLIGSLIQLIFPFLTQSIVDIGIARKNLDFIYLVLLGQMMLFAGRISLEFIRSWILLHISTRINFSILSDFLVRLMRLPLSFFDAKRHGDIMQRFQDHTYIEAFLTNTTLNVVFSLINVLVFGVVLCFYSWLIFLIFLGGSILYGIWVALFLQYRRALNFKRFDYMSREQGNLIGLISGMQDIKLANAEVDKRWDWERLRAGLFRINVKVMASSQYQQVGGLFLNEGKNILITFLAAKLVLQGDITLGAMLSVQYIIGQLNAPVEQLVQFTQTAQDALISAERLNEIYTLEHEDVRSGEQTGDLPLDKSISIAGLQFRYPGTEAQARPVLNNIHLHIPEGRVTAIVGVSGSGKTTLLKLLLKFYNPHQGTICVGRENLASIRHAAWRSQCGVVMQDGFIFSDTVEGNVCIGDRNPDPARLDEALRIANIKSFVDTLPLGVHTMIGADGTGLSQGQKQRILIARAVYKDPRFICFDEATNSLDANNERAIMENLDRFFVGRTVVIVAHRLSTVRNAHNIVVLDGGEIVESGAHDVLVGKKGKYYELVKNQLELGT
ncbi:peptidase domain-containing ABC transporter [Dinghuibacter silviterrae]|uniref:ATP-binding cassette subfamily B protein n=1 Tax=Dinghuibacter silviterrae TaxID=1539049 RepID=A0A4R8DIH4_9BACT|nr:peptidase domain-containing ABC transporter [Dinghuibacter silviterrae]TDW96966.1 ATP-binding cassette subfamily B protein [Dinghuibacter silviterrae]